MEIHLWPVYVARHSPDESRHFLSVLSQDPDTSASSSLGSNAMQVTPFLPSQHLPSQHVSYIVTDTSDP